MSRRDDVAAQMPELVKLAARAMVNDPESPSGELVRAWRTLVRERDRYRRALEKFAAMPEGVGPYSGVQKCAREALDA